MGSSAVLVSVIIAVVCLVAVLAPFYFGMGGSLAAASAVKSKEQLEKIKVALAKRYIRDEQAYQNKEISKRAWQARQEFLLRRFMDTARRQDYIEHIERVQGGQN